MLAGARLPCRAPALEAFAINTRVTLDAADGPDLQQALAQGAKHVYPSNLRWFLTQVRPPHSDAGPLPAAQSLSH